MSIQALREQRAAKAKALNEFVNSKDYTPEGFDALDNELQAIDDRIKHTQAAIERVANEQLGNQIADAADRVAHDERSTASALFAKWVREGDRAIKDADWAILRNTMSTTTNSEGGFTVATEVAGTVLDALLQFGGMRAVSDVMRTTQGNPMQFPTSDGTAEVGEILAENASATDLDIAFGTKALPVYKYSSKVVTVPIELLMDSNVDIEAFVISRLSTRLGRITNTHFTTGTGTNQPTGVVTAAAVGVTAANATSQVTAVTYDSLVNLQHSVDSAYRELGNCRFMFNDTTLREIRKIKDSSNRPIFVPGYESTNPGGAPDRLLGYPIQINQSVASMAASAKSILFGDFSFYKIRDVMDVTVQRYTDSAFAKKGQVGFLAWLRSGGNLIDVGGAVKVFVNAAS